AAARGTAEGEHDEEEGRSGTQHGRPPSNGERPPPNVQETYYRSVILRIAHGERRPAGAGRVLLRATSRSFLRDPMAAVPLLTGVERRMLMEIVDDMRQFRQDPMARLRYADYDEVNMSLEQFMEAMIEKFPPEIRLKGLAPEERVKGLAPEERVKGL